MCAIKKVRLERAFLGYLWLWVSTTLKPFQQLWTWILDAMEPCVRISELSLPWNGSLPNNKLLCKIGSLSLKLPAYLASQPFLRCCIVLTWGCIQNALAAFGEKLKNDKINSKPSFATPYRVYSYLGLAHLGYVFHLLSMSAIRLLVWETVYWFKLGSSISFPLWGNVVSHLGASPRAGGTGPWQSHWMPSAHPYPFEIRLRRTPGTAQMGLGVPKRKINSLRVCVVRRLRLSRLQYCCAVFALWDDRCLCVRASYVHLSPTLHSVILSWYLDIGQGGIIFTMEICKHYKSGMFIFLVFSFFCSDWIIPVDLSLSSLALSSVISNLLLIPWSF